MSDGGKGSTQRPTDKKKFDEGWDRIFGKKPPKVFPHQVDLTEAYIQQGRASDAKLIGKYLNGEALNLNEQYQVNEWRKDLRKQAEEQQELRRQESDFIDSGGN
jgi:hypothetical protein